MYSSLQTVRSRWLGWRVLSLLSKHRKTAIGLLLLIAAATSLDVAVPFLTRNLVDRILRSLTSGGAESVRGIASVAAAIFALTAGTRLLRSLYNYRVMIMASKAEDEVKNTAFGNFLRLDTEFHTKVNTGEIVGALDRGGTAIFVSINEILGQNLVPPVLIAAGVLTSLALRNVWIALLVFSPLPAYLITIARRSSRIQAAEQDVSRAFENVTKESYDIASNVRSVKKFGREEQEARTQLGLLAVARSKHYRAERLWTGSENIQSFIATAGRVGVIALGGFFVLTRHCTVGDFVLFLAMQDMIYGPISQLSIVLPKLRRNLSRAERLFEILDERPSICDNPGAVPLSFGQHSIEFRDVSFRYPGCDRWALRHINLFVPAGSSVALIGASGSGKSTLMSLLQRLYNPQEGTVLIDGRDIRGYTQQSLRQQLAVVPQEVDLFSRSVAVNIAYGSENLSGRSIEEAARLAQAHDFIRRSEHGYQTSVGERGAKLSGGERQRLGIARAVACDPTILVFDEATSHLDNESERLIQSALERITRGRTSFIIAHRLSTVRNAGLVVVFRQGTIEAVGRHGELSHSSSTYRTLHKIHADNEFSPPFDTAGETLQAVA